MGVEKHMIIFKWYSRRVKGKPWTGLQVNGSYLHAWNTKRVKPAIMKDRIKVYLRSTWKNYECENFEDFTKAITQVITHEYTHKLQRRNVKSQQFRTMNVEPQADIMDGYREPRMNWKNKAKRALWKLWNRE